ncbi:transcriptional antiterminator, partial [Enterococcus hirae]
WSEFRSEIRKPTIKIHAALLLDAPAGHLKMLKEEIEYHFRNTYEVDILLPIAQNSVNQLKHYDCVLTNGFNTGDLGDVKIIGVPNYFGEEFVKKLHHFLINKKEELHVFRKNILI